MSPSGALSRSMMTGAWSLGRLALAKFAVDPGGAHACFHRRLARIRSMRMPRFLNMPAAVPVAEHASGGPVVAVLIAQPDLAEARQCGPLRLGDVGMADEAAGSKTSASAGDVHVSAQRHVGYGPAAVRRCAAPQANRARSDSDRSPARAPLGM